MSVNLKNSVIAHYKMNDNLPTPVVVDSTGTKNGTYSDLGVPVNTNTGSVAGKINRALDLDTDEDVDVGNHGGSVKSIVMWINPDAVNIIEWPISLDASSGIKITNGVVSKEGFASGTQVIYVDGEVGTIITANWHLIGLTSTVGYTASLLFIGRLSGTAFNGLVDSVILFNKILNKQEWAWLYNRGHGTENLMPNWLKYWNWGPFN